MAYIKPPPPKDSEIAFEVGPDGKPWTWGSVRELEKSIDELEANDETVRAARQRLDETLTKHGLILDIGPVPLVCEFCGQTEYQQHFEDCEDYGKNIPPERIAAGYQWLDEFFQVVHTSSVCVDDYEACDYFRIVQVWHPATKIKYLMRRDLGARDYKMRPWQFDAETGAVDPIEKPGS